MRCPVCSIPMIVVEHESIELDYCTRCRGVWFDSGELEMLVHKMNLEDSGLPISRVLELPEVPSAENKRRCPLCRGRMKKSELGESPGVIVDICPRGEGLWFDGGEVGQLASRLSSRSGVQAGSQEHIVSFLGKVFQAGE